MSIPNSLFKRSYNKTYKTYSLSFRGLSKTQANIIEYMFKHLSSDGVIESRMNGFTYPALLLSTEIPLAPSVGNTFCVPNALLNSIVSPFRNDEFACKDELVDYRGKLISNVNIYG